MTAIDDESDDIVVVQSSKHVRSLEFGKEQSVMHPNMQTPPSVNKMQMPVPNSRPVQTFLADGSSRVTQNVTMGGAPMMQSKPVQQVFFADGSSKTHLVPGNKAATIPMQGQLNAQVKPPSNGPKSGAAEIESSDDDIVELIDDDDELSQDSQMLSEEQPMDITSQEDSQDSITDLTPIHDPVVKNTNELASGFSSDDGKNKGDLPEWSTSNRGVNSATGIEPSRDSPSRSMADLRQNPNDVIVCSMPDVEAYFTEHIVQFSSYVSSMTFGKPSYSCPECRVTGLKGDALKQHLEVHVGKKIKWKSLINPKHTPLPVPEMMQQPDTPTKDRTMLRLPNTPTKERNVTPGSNKKDRNMLKLKRSPVERIRSLGMNENGGRRWEGKDGMLGHHIRRKEGRLVGQGVNKARQNFNNTLGRILQRERNIRRGKLTRSPLKRFSSLSAMYSKAKASTCRRSLLTDQSSNGNPVETDFSMDANGQSSRTQDADIYKQSYTDMTKQQANQDIHQESGIPAKSNSSQTDVAEVVDLVDSDALEIISINSDDTDMTNAMTTSQDDLDQPSEASSADDLFLTIDDILKEHFTKEEKQRTRMGMNFLVGHYKCRRCNFTTLTVLDVPEHVAFHIKRKVILKIKMDK